MSIDLTKPLQLSNGVLVNLFKSNSRCREIVVTVADDHKVTTGSHTYVPGSPMAFDEATLKHVCSDLTLQNVKTFDPAKPVQTRDGRKVRILATDLNTSFGPRLSVAITGHNGWEFVDTYREGGRVFVDRERPDDLINVITYGDVLQNSGTGVNVTTVDGVVTKVELVS